MNLGSRISQFQGSDKDVLKGQDSSGHSHIVPNISVTRYKNHSPHIMDKETDPVKSDWAKVTQYVKVDSNGTSILKLADPI